MNSPLPLPEWVPWWVHLALLLLGLLFAALFLLMPFSVFGVKARLEGVEARLDEIQGEIRALSLRLPEMVEEPDTYADEYAPRAPNRPPIPPAPAAAPYRRSDGRGVPGRNEPRLY